MQSYLATAGSSKVGFSVVDRKADGTPVHIRNLRGVIERNTMRYYLAIEAFLGAHAAPEVRPGRKTPAGLVCRNRASRVAIART